MITQKPKLNLNPFFRYYPILIISILLIQAGVFLFFGEDSYIAIHDNLDIHITDYQLLREQDAFFSQSSTLPILGGISRDFLLSEFSLYSFLYLLFPTFTAYILGYFLKILIAMASGILLGREILGSQYPEYRWLVVMMSFLYGLLPLYPAFSFSFASIPLFLYLVRRFETTGKGRYLLFIFLYPLLSYFTFFGLFLVGYLCLYTLYVFFRKDRKGALRLSLAVFLLSAGYILVEYRLFRLIFFSGEPTIRETMANTNLGLAGILSETVYVFTHSIFHAEDLHRFIVLPVVLFAFVIQNLLYLKHRELQKAVRDPLNIVFLFVLFNCFIYGLYYSAFFRGLIETLLPPLKGWQFNRTVFFNPFLWYLAFGITIFKLSRKHFHALSVFLLLAALLVPLGIQSLYNDFYNTVYTHAYELIKKKETESLSYREFFSENLFQSIKEEIHYQGEYCAAYGFHPAVLTYNGISTLDACLSHYYQSYKEEFRQLIAPALMQSETARTYFDDWGGRAYLFSAHQESIWNPVKTMKLAEDELLIDPQVFTQMGGVYLFSRIPLSNAKELGLNSLGKFEDSHSPYTIWLYKATAPASNVLED